MQNFVHFDPILKQSPEDIVNYYQQNNLELPDNKYLLNYVSPVLSIPEETKFQVGQKGTISKKPLPEIKKINEDNINLDKKIPSPLTAYKNIEENPKDSVEFIKEFTPLVEHYSKELGLPADLMLAQIALESGWGSKAPGFNYGGQKVGKDWKGKIQSFTTTEFLKNKGYIKSNNEKFRSYANPKEGIKGYFDFFRSYDRYKPLFGVSDPFKGADIMQKTKYATDPKYSKKLKDVIKTVQRLRKEQNI